MLGEAGRQGLWARLRGGAGAGQAQDIDTAAYGSVQQERGPAVQEHQQVKAASCSQLRLGVSLLALCPGRPQGPRASRSPLALCQSVGVILDDDLHPVLTQLCPQDQVLVLQIFHLLPQDLIVHL